jgi:release factor glutamine methyltransferase
MLTVLDSIKLSTEYLEKKGIESARTNAELLLADVLKCKRLQLYLSFDRPLKDNEIQKYRDYISRRGNFEPLQYILGYVEFYGLNFIVNKNVLIPRQETEILLDTIIENYQSNEKLKILDIGTGSGNIAVALAHEFENAQITGLDISDEALQVASKNAESNKVEEKIIFHKEDILNNNFYPEEKYDLIVSNPPYVKLEDYKNLQKEITVHEPIEAVTDKNDGLEYYNKISELSHKLLKQGGKLFLELEKDAGEKVKYILVKNNFKNIKIIKDYSDFDRVIYGEL